MEDFFLGIITSIIASLLFVLVTKLKFKYHLSAFLSWISNNDLIFKYPNKESAKKDIQSHVSKTSRILIFAGRGNELRRDPFDQFFHKRPANKKIELKILLPNPFDPIDKFNWLAQREQELAGFDSSYKTNTLQTELVASIQYLTEYVNSSQCELRLFNFAHIGRFIITDQYLYLTPYSNKKHARDCALYKFRRGELFDNYERIFWQVWHVSEPPPSI